MVVFFVATLGRAIMCVSASSLTCTQIPTDVLTILVLGGLTELVIEIGGGLAKIYRLKNKDEDQNNHN